MVKTCSSNLHIVSIAFLLLTLSSQPIDAQRPTNISECTPTPTTSGKDTFPEVKGRSDSQELWALLFPYHLPIQTGEEIKIVWRMTGNGTFSLLARHSDGTISTPLWGPEEHGGSNWNHPGQEWGTGFRFPKAGCWRIIVQRGNDSGEVDLLIVERPEWEVF